MNPFKLFYLVGLFFFAGSVANAAESFPGDVQHFMKNAEACERYSEEWNSSLPKERQLEIEGNADKYCKMARKEQETLTEKYKADESLREKIAAYAF